MTRFTDINGIPLKNKVREETAKELLDIIYDYAFEVLPNGSSEDLYDAIAKHINKNYLYKS